MSILDDITFRTKPLLLSILVFIITFANSGPSAPRILLYFSFVLVLVFIPLLKSRTKFFNSKVIYADLALVLFNAIVLFAYYEDFTSIYNGLLYMACILFFLVLMNFSTNLKNTEAFIRYISIGTKILMILAVGLSLSGIDFQWVSRTAFFFLLLYFILLDKKTKKPGKILYMGIWLLIAAIDGERTFMLLFPVLLFLILSVDWVFDHKKLYRILFILMVIFIISIPVIYVMLSHSEYKDLLNEYAIRYTKSRFFSGRDVIWSNMFEYYLKGNIFLGSGHHVTPTTIYGAELSSHNTYMSILIRTGLIGLFLFLYFLWSVWNRYLEFKDVEAVKLSAVFLIITMLKQSSEMALIGNNVSVSVINWLVIAFGFVYCNSLNYQNKMERGFEVDHNREQ
ncbi:O-antigen ligase family protein [Acetivibrio mesophilus]|uniref:O-antigen ligase-related domain-containing protein n=1 Tax=Acetivibrio mesophilus TaxID=2487273 RepID=A0A4Q0I4X8_9FIRM|nr:O-antigen ligase family protein [Acetivibrio mesophilus]RXE58002.1 hypothetical protein EFD62_14570 [Acetivibrio mesophilus]HHV30641.1 hypothetical protein [Clostridium sp.]